MALPQFQEHWSEPADSAVTTTDWESLRHDLESLLHQVENRHLRGGSTDPHGHGGSPDARHRAALKSVQRAVQRFSEPASAPAQRTSDLETAIDEIRARTGGPSPHRPPAAARRMPYLPAEFEEDLRAEQPYAPRHPLRPAPQAPHSNAESVAGLQKLNSAVSGMAGRLERLEADMRATRDASGDIAEIASQVGQLTNVVELIAGAVGEQGQVKRLESQIAELARLYSDGPKPEIASLTRRIDELGATVDRLAELQVQEMGRAARESEGAASTQGDAMRAIEDGVRSIYDRIDTLESSYAIAPDDLDRLSREMAGVTEALRHSGDGKTLAGIVERLETLSGQIGGMGQAGDSSVSALRDDVQALRDIVGEAVEPRFAALESRLEKLTSRVGGGAVSADFPELEEQIRHLAQRMDQTGQQLTGLTELYKADPGRDAPPDYEALAAMVAERTSQEVARRRGDETGIGLDESSLGALEQRLSKLFTDHRSAEAPGLLTSVAENLTRVGERLDRLEGALENLTHKGIAPAQPSRLDSKDKGPAKTASEPAVAKAGTASAAAAQNGAPATASGNPATPAIPATAMSDPLGAPRAPQQSDDMPHAPSSERPLVDDELSSLAAPVEDWSSIGMAEPGQSQTRPQQPPPQLPGFDTSKIERPARPKSSFADEPPGFTPLDETHDVSVLAEPAVDETAPISDRSTFIAAARRAARGNLEAQQSADASQSLIGKALARFQSSKPEAAKPEPAPEMTETTPVDEKSQATELPEGKATLEDFTADIADRPGTGKKKQKGFFGRHRRSLMLAGALVATILLAFNLVVQRLMPDPASVENAAIETPAEVGSLIDPTPTGSIDPKIEMNLTTPSPTRQILPATLTPDPMPGATTLDPTFTHSVPPARPDPIMAAPAPIKLELPPEELGPVDLRQAAAEGDPRAQFEIGAIYTEGSVVAQNFKQAATWYERSAARGFAPAQYRLGNLYEHGNGVDKDLEQARLWYTRAAEAGNRLAMHNLASLYASGELGDQQFAAAAEWFERASESGMTDSQFNLGMLYARGLGVTQNLKTSYKWFSLAAEGGDKDAAKARDDIGKSLDDVQLAEAKTDISTWHMAPIDIPANFAPIGTWSDDFDPGQTITERKVTEGVQKALARLGYDPGTIDGVMGPKTTQAITEFERATGMTPTGLVNPRLLAVLGSQPV